MEKNQLFKLVENSELSHHLNFFKHHIRPAIDIIRLPIDSPLGGSRLGGNPDLPIDMAWPEHTYGPYRFIGQINFAEVPNNVLLPKTGLLSLFFAEDPQDNIFWQDPNYVIGIYTPAGIPLITKSTPDTFPHHPHKSIAISFALTWDIPFDEYQVKDWPFTKEEDDTFIYSELLRDSLHQSPSYLLGYPSHCSLCYDPTPDGNFISLINLPSYNDLNWCWHDGDCLMVFIDKDELAKGNFTTLKADAG